MSSVLSSSRDTLLCFALFCCFAIGQAKGQFTTIINVPPDVAPSSIGSDTQLNLFQGIALRFVFSRRASDGTSSNVEVNITGGSVGIFFDANSGSVVNISGGSVGSSFSTQTLGVS